MAGEDTTTRRADLVDAVRAIENAGSKNDLIAAIDKALGVAAPMGDPDTIESAAKAYGKAADHCRHEVEEQVEQVAKKALPQAWDGMASGSAQRVVAAAARTAEQIREAFEQGKKALGSLADGVRDAQRQDGPGREALSRARTMLGSEDGFWDDLVEKDAEEAEKERAREIARTGAETRHAAAVRADNAAREAARDLNKLAAEARSGKITGKGLSAVDKVMLADTAVVKEDSAAREYNEILSANDLERSSDRLNNMSPADRAEFQRILDRAGTPERQAYLMKALAAGHDVESVREFSEKIEGKNQAWLRRHLAPVVTDAPGGSPDYSEKDNKFHRQEWAQGGDGSEGTCVASSTVHARAMVDPIYALELTGGPSGQEESGEAFRERLVDEQHRVHDEGDGGYDGWFGTGPPSGMDNEGWSEVADKELNSTTGANYERQELSTANDRRGVLPEIEEAVAEGRPVPIRVDGADSAHALVIVGQEGNMLQVHNPWGHTVWVSENDFVNGNMGVASHGHLPDATGVHLPK
ncbi:WXG100 family type VII secretion target [Streptomyces sp. NPDC002851]